jgi:hypothetical protein
MGAFYLQDVIHVVASIPTAAGCRRVGDLQDVMYAEESANLSVDDFNFLEKVLILT